MRVQPPTDSPIDGERKTVTALFADIKGSMDLMEDLDPEAARALVDPALKLMIDAVHRYDGYIVQSTGDGIFALFGAPLAHEDHPQRALYAALRMQDEMRRYSTTLRESGNPPIETRVGVNTGEVVVRSIRTDDQHTEYTPIGHSISLAARMQALAPTGSTAVTEATQKFCAGYFSFKALGPTRVKGASEPINVFEVSGLGPLRTRLQRAAGRGLTKFVGRHRELDAMHHAAEQARAGHGQIVAAMAEAGVGKSRLFFEFKAAAQSGWMVLETFSVSHGRASAYLPVIDLLRNYFRINSEDDERIRREKITGRVVALDRALEDTLPYLFALLGIAEGADPRLGSDAQIRKRSTLEAIKRLLLRESLNQPLMVVFEDLHWVDDESQALLNLLADSIGTAKILLLVNYRPEYSHGWGSKTYYTQLRLDPLGKESADEMLSALLTSPAAAASAAGAHRERSGGDLQVADRVRVQDELAALKRLIIERTEGNPFFMEETVQVLLDEGALVRNGSMRLTRPLAELKIPPTVQAILAARIDRLPAAEKDLLQTLAVIGKEFSLGLVRQVLLPQSAAGSASGTSAALDAMLSDLQTGEFIYEQPAAGDIEYSFKHALTQEVAYNSILTARRTAMHQRIGAAIEALFADRLDDHLSALARHYGLSADTRKAIVYLGRAGRQAAERSAHTEAYADFTRALHLLQTLPDDLERARLELSIRGPLSQPLQVVTGSTGAPELETHHARVLELCRLTGEETELFGALFGLRLTYTISGALRRAREVGERMLAVAERHHDSAEIAASHFAIAQNLVSLGEFAAAARHCEQGLAAAQTVRGKATFIAVEPRAVMLCTWSHALCALGFPDQARKAATDAIAIARTDSRPFGLVLALAFDSELQQLLRNGPRSVEQADATIGCALEIGAVSQVGRVASIRAGGLVELGRYEEAIEQLRFALAGAQANGVGLLAQGYCSLAQAYAALGRHEEGFEALRTITKIVERTEEHQFDAEIHRLKGELTLIRDPATLDEAEACFIEAIAVARRQSARWWELRATRGLARMLAKRGRSDEARTILAEIYNWFTEGFDTADLKDAKALLDELGR